MLTLDSFGAVALLKVGSKWLVQEKTPGYGVAAYVGRLALVGGAWDIGDSNPRHTVSREILEEVRNEKNVLFRILFVEERRNF